MKNEFNLSEKIERRNLDESGFRSITYLKIKDVKEFIKRLKDKIMSSSDLPTTTSAQVKAFDFCLEEIDKLAGEELK